MIKKLKYFIFPVAVLMPVFTSAQPVDAVNNFVSTIQGWTGLLLPTLIALALVLFLWGVLRYLFSKDGPAKKEARDFMMWGIVALFVMVSVWGLVKVLQDVIFGGDKDVTSPIPPPVLPGQSR
jgi:glucose uptake protein GlcU